MALGVALIIGLLAVAVFSVAAGHFSQRVDFYFLGVFVLFFVGLSLVSQGYSVVSGYELDRNETETPNTDNSTDKVVSEVQNVTRESVSDSFSNAFGLLFLLIAGALSLTYFRGERLKREERRRSLDVDDDF